VALAFADERDALAQLRPGIDGVILEAGWRRATFLPQVWEQLPEPREFLAALKHKAGLPEDYWSVQVRVARYTVAKFTERTAMAAGVAP
jgi:AMMECR1 domain-containing protein